MMYICAVYWHLSLLRKRQGCSRWEWTAYREKRDGDLENKANGKVGKKLEV